jgi:hypothetical protein
VTRARLEALAVGAWLGAMQVTLAFALLCNQGGGAPSLIRTVAAWMLGGVLGAMTLGPRAWSIAFVLAATLHVFIPWWLLRASASGSPLEGAMGLFASCVGGACGAGFLRVRSLDRELPVPALLALEGAGFALGYVGASIVLVLRASALPALGLGAAVIAWVLGRRTLRVRT